MMHFKQLQLSPRFLRNLALGTLAGIALVFALSLPNKYALTCALGIAIAPAVLIFREKQRLFIAMYLLSLPISIGYTLLMNLQGTSTKAPYVFKFWISDILLILILVIQSSKEFSKRCNAATRFWPNRFAAPLLIWITIAAVSLIPAIDHTATFIGILQLVRIFIVYTCFYRYIKDWREVRFIIICLMSALLLQSFLMFAQYATGTLVLAPPGMHPYLDMTDAGLRPSGTLGHSGHYAKFSMLILPIVLALGFFSSTRRSKWLCLAVWAAASFALMLTISRLGMATWVLSFLFLSMGLVWLRLASFRVTICTIILLMTLLPVLFITVGSRFQSRISDDQGSASVRAPMAQVAYNIIRAHPLLGVGLMNYTVVHRRYDNTPEQISSELPDLPVHNLFLLYAAELGIPGLIVFLWFSYRLFGSSLYCARNASVAAEKVTYLGVAIGFAALLLQSLFAMGAADHVIHLSIVAIFAACIAKRSPVLITNSFPDSLVQVQHGTLLENSLR